jgi:hypothetical protein
MGKVPVYLVEEHHESFLLWHHAVLEGQLPRAGSQLIHIDEHPDLFPAQVDTPLGDLFGDFERALRVTYGQLNIANFIAPALYSGIFDRLYWVREGREARPPSDHAVYSYRGEGRCLFLSTADKLRQGPARADVRPFLYEEVTAAAALPPLASVALDIDLDYFLCAPLEPSGLTLEISPREYQAYLDNRYHALRIMPRSACRVFERDGACFLEFTSRVPPGVEQARQVKDPEAQIGERLAALGRFLVSNGVIPRLVTVCRSRISGYTPAEHCAQIEAGLLQHLADLYEIEVRYVMDMFPRLPREVAHGHGLH